MNKRLLSGIASFAIVTSVMGCATTIPQPKKIDISAIPVQPVNIPSTPGSIWPGETLRNSLFQDMKARYVGDTVTVLISENANAVKAASTSTARTSSDNAAIQNLFGVPLNMGMKFNAANPFSPQFQDSYNSKFAGNGTTKRSGVLTAVIAARVVNVLPNGNLVLEGRKDMVINNELQYIVLSGMVRPEDLSNNNTVSSNQLSDARIEYSGNGVLSDEQRPGWLRRIFDNVWPF